MPRHAPTQTTAASRAWPPCQAGNRASRCCADPALRWVPGLQHEAGHACQRRAAPPRARAQAGRAEARKAVLARRRRGALAERAVAAGVHPVRGGRAGGLLGQPHVQPAEAGGHGLPVRAHTCVSCSKAKDSTSRPARAAHLGQVALLRPDVVHRRVVAALGRAGAQEEQVRILERAARPLARRAGRASRCSGCERARQQRR